MTAMNKAFLTTLSTLAHDSAPLTEQSELQKDLGLDSLGMAQLIALMEEDYGVQSPDPQAMKTVGDAMALIAMRERKEIGSSGWTARLHAPAQTSLDDYLDLNWTLSDRILTGASRCIMNGWFAFWHRLKIHGLEKLPAKGPFLLCPNHQSYPDPLFLYSRLPRFQLERMLFIGWGGAFRRAPLSWIRRIGRILPTGGNSRHPECLKYAYDALQRGMSICIFPEGGRTTTRELMKPRLGAGILSHEAKVPIYPVRLEGALESMSRHHPGVHFCRVTMTVLDPIYPENNVTASMDTYEKLMLRWKDSILGEVS